MSGFNGLMPKSKMMVEFFQLFAETHNKEGSAKEVGYSDKWIRTKMYPSLKRYASYVHFLQEQHAKEIAKVTAISKQSVIEEIGKVAFANPQDFVERVPNSPDDAPKFRLKRFDKLTRDQAAAIGEFKILADGSVEFSLLKKTPTLIALAKSFGLFSERLIVQHHHAHLHARVNLEKVPSKVLDEAEKLLTSAGAQVYEGQSKEV